MSTIASPKDNDNEKLKQRLSEFEIVKDCINADITHLRTVWTAITGSMFTLFITTIVAFYSNKIDTQSSTLIFGSLFLVIGFLLIMIIYVYYEQDELNQTLTWLTIFWFENNINIPQALELYLEIKKRFRFYRSTIYLSETVKKFLSFTDRIMIRYRFWIMITTGLIIPFILFLWWEFYLPDPNLSITRIFLAIASITLLYLVSLFQLRFSSKTKIEHIELIFFILNPDIIYADKMIIAERLIKNSFQIESFNDIDKYYYSMKKDQNQMNKNNNSDSSNPNKNEENK